MKRGNNKSNSYKYSCATHQPIPISTVKLNKFKTRGEIL